MGNNKEVDGTTVGLVVGICFPIFLALAPKEIREELIDYAGKFIGVLFLIAVAWFVWGIIKDKRRHKRDMQNNKRED